jgi:hypothetical protein
MLLHPKSCQYPTWYHYQCGGRISQAFLIFRQLPTTNSNSSPPDLVDTSIASLLNMKCIHHSLWAQVYLFSSHSLYLCPQNPLILPFILDFILPPYLVYYFWGDSTGVWTLGVMFARQALLSLEPLRQPYFILGIFKIGYLQLFCLDWLLAVPFNLCLLNS